MRTLLIFAALLNLAAGSSPDHELVRQTVTESPFVGSWTADLSTSKLDPKLPLKGADITIGVRGNVVTLASSIILPTGATYRETETLRADGTETAATQTAGVVHVANWVGPHVLALIARKGNQNIALITYEVSSDGQKLTARTSGPIEQVVTFKRR